MCRRSSRARIRDSSAGSYSVPSGCSGVGVGGKMAGDGAGAGGVDDEEASPPSPAAAPPELLVVPPGASFITIGGGGCAAAAALPVFILLCILNLHNERNTRYASR